MISYVLIFVISGALYYYSEGIIRIFETKDFIRQVPQTSLWMFLLGGIGGLILNELNLSGMPILFKMIIFTSCIFIMELGFGILFNIILKLNLWDYSDKPFNLLGQVYLYEYIFGFLFVPILLNFSDIILWLVYRYDKFSVYNLINYYIRIVTDFL